MVQSVLQAKRYSQAVFEIAVERKELDRWQSDLQKIALVAQNTEFVAILENPRFPFENKVKLLESQLGEINLLALNLTLILTNRGNFGLITDIYANYQELLDSYYGIDKAEVTTAIPLDDQERAQLTAYLGTITGKKIVLTEKLDPDIIGGIITRVGGKIIDGSTRSQLAALKNELVSARR